MQWLITGCSSGLGLSLARTIAKTPNQTLIATSRDPPSSPAAVDEITAHPNAVWCPLDVASPALETQLAAILTAHGPIDVLINNAGYATGGPLESTPLSHVRAQFETNLLGPIRVMQALIPRFRANSRGGVIVNVSSAAFWASHPGAGVYSASKWALEGLSESLADELAPFGVRVLIAQPGGMRTAFVHPEKMRGLVPAPEAYVGTPAEVVLKAIAESHGRQGLNPERAAGAIVREVLEPTEVVQGEGEGRKLLRLQLGGECVEAMGKQIGKLEREGERVREVALACDFE